MNLKHPFLQETRLLYLYEYGCKNCDRSNDGLELHHLLGRISSSPFNAMLLCRTCHDKVTQNDEETKKFFKININFLLKFHYNPTNEDWLFLKQNANRLGLNEL